MAIIVNLDVMMAKRKISSGEGVERTFQTYSPLIASIEVKRKGDHVTLVTWGKMLHACLTAAGELAAGGVECEVVDLRSLRGQIAVVDGAAFAPVAEDVWHALRS